MLSSERRFRPAGWIAKNGSSDKGGAAAVDRVITKGSLLCATEVVAEAAAQGKRNRACIGKLTYCLNVDYMCHENSLWTGRIWLFVGPRYAQQRSAYLRECVEPHRFPRVTYAEQHPGDVRYQHCYLLLLQAKPFRTGIVLQSNS